MSGELSFAELLCRLRDNDQDAAVELVDRYTRRLVGLAWNHLDSRIRTKEDPQDVIQSVFKSFFHRCTLGQFHLENHDDLWALLVRLTLNKCGHRVEFYEAEKRNIHHETRIHPSTESSRMEWEELAREPSPVEAVELADLVEYLLSGLEPHQQEIVRLSLEGEGTAEIATRTGMIQRTVQRVLKGVRERLERWNADAQAENS
jgi:RNA polymerase sigma-70 factor (ECF subfamily)